jgi:hypothetical protein
MLEARGAVQLIESTVDRFVLRVLIVQNYLTISPPPQRLGDLPFLKFIWLYSRGRNYLGWQNLGWLNTPLGAEAVECNA